MVDILGAVRRLKIYIKDPDNIEWVDGDYKFGRCKVLLDILIITDYLMEDFTECS
jgi:hypothetical protein